MPEATLPPEEQLKALLYQYVNLYERWSEDRQVFAKKGADLACVLQDFQAAIERLGTLEEQVRDRITQHLNTLLPTVREAIVKTATEDVQEKLQTAAERLEDIVWQTERTLQKSLWEVVKSRMLWCGVAVLGAALTGVVVTQLLLPHTLYSLTPYQIQVMEVGENFEGLLRRLSPAEEKRFLKSLKVLEKKHQKPSALVPTR